MKKYYVMGSLLFLAITLSCLILVMDKNGGQDTVRYSPASATTVAEASGSGTAADEQKVLEQARNARQAAFLKLQESRSHLKSRANLLKSKIWGLELPAEQASQVTYKMRKAFAYLKNPSMLGAYLTVEEIRNETSRVDAMQEELREVENLLEASSKGQG